MQLKMRYLKYVVLIFIALSFLNDCSFSTLTTVNNHPESGKLISFKDGAVMSVSLSGFSFFDDAIHSNYDKGIIQRESFERLLGNWDSEIVKSDVLSEKVFLIKRVFRLSHYGLAALFSSPSIYLELEDVEDHNIYVIYYYSFVKDLYNEF